MPQPHTAARPPSRTILGFLDKIDDATVAGWALDPINPRTPLAMRVIIDGTVAEVIACDISRPDVAALNLPSAKVGFEFRIPPRFQDGLRHVLGFATIEGDRLRAGTV